MGKDSRSSAERLSQKQLQNTSGICKDVLVVESFKSSNHSCVNVIHFNPIDQSRQDSVDRLVHSSRSETLVIKFLIFQ